MVDTWIPAVQREISRNRSIVEALQFDSQGDDTNGHRANLNNQGTVCTHGSSGEGVHMRHRTPINAKRSGGTTPVSTQPLERLNSPQYFEGAMETSTRGFERTSSNIRTLSANQLHSAQTPSTYKHGDPRSKEFSANSRPNSAGLTKRSLQQSQQSDEHINEIAELRHENKTFQTRLNKADRVCQQYRLVLTQVTNERDSLVKEREVLEGRLKRANNSKKTATDKLQSATLGRARRDQRLTHLQSDLAAAQARVKDYSRHLKICASRKQRMATQEAQMKKHQEEVAKLMNALESVGKSVALAEKRATLAEHRAHDTQVKLNLAHETISSLAELVDQDNKHGFVDHQNECAYTNNSNSPSDLSAKSEPMYNRNGHIPKTKTVPPPQLPIQTLDSEYYARPSPYLGRTPVQRRDNEDTVTQDSLSEIDDDELSQWTANGGDGSSGSLGVNDADLEATDNEFLTQASFAHERSRCSVELPPEKIISHLRSLSGQRHHKQTPQFKTLGNSNRSNGRDAQQQGVEVVKCVDVDDLDSEIDGPSSLVNRGGMPWSASGPNSPSGGDGINSGNLATHDLSLDDTASSAELDAMSAVVDVDGDREIEQVRYGNYSAKNDRASLSQNNFDDSYMETDSFSNIQGRVQNMDESKHIIVDHTHQITDLKEQQVGERWDTRSLGSESDRVISEIDEYVSDAYVSESEPEEIEEKDYASTGYVISPPPLPSHEPPQHHRKQQHQLKCQTNNETLHENNNQQQMKYDGNKEVSNGINSVEEHHNMQQQIKYKGNDEFSNDNSIFSLAMPDEDLKTMSKHKEINSILSQCSPTSSHGAQSTPRRGNKVVNSLSVAALGRLSILQRLHVLDLVRFAEVTEERLVEAGHVLVAKGEVCNCAFYVLDGGPVMISNANDGAVAQRGPDGVWLCETALLVSEPAPCDIVCVEETTVLELQRDQFVEALLVLSNDAVYQQHEIVSTVVDGDNTHNDINSARECTELSTEGCT